MKTIVVATAAALLVALAAPAPALAHRRHHHHNHGAVWGAALGGTALGLILGTAAAQKARPAQPQVVVVQPPQRPVGDVNYAGAAELERARQENARLQMEMERLRILRARAEASADEAEE